MDSSALFAGVASATGAARALLVLGEAGRVSIVVSEQVLVETERAVARKVPEALPYLRRALRASRFRILDDPPTEALEQHAGLISHRADLPILVAAMREGVGFPVTHNHRHFLQAGLPEASGLLIGSPGDGLKWLLERLART
jgi:hypothetical protein